MQHHEVNRKQDVDILVLSVAFLCSWQLMILYYYISKYNTSIKKTQQVIVKNFKLKCEKIKDVIALPSNRNSLFTLVCVSLLIFFSLPRRSGQDSLSKKQNSNQISDY